MPRWGCQNGLFIILCHPLAVCAMGQWDAGVAGGDPCVLREIRKDQCRNLGGVAVQRSAVAAKMEPFARIGRVCKTES